MNTLNELKISLERDEEVGKIKEQEAIIVKQEAEEQSATANEKATLMEMKRNEAKLKLKDVKHDEVAQILKNKADSTMLKFFEFLCILIMDKNYKPKPSKNEDPKNPNPQLNYFEHFKKSKYGKMTGTDFLKFLRNFDVTKMPEAQMKELKDKIDQVTPENFNPERKSQATKIMFEAIKTYNNIFYINLDYLPLKKLADESNEKLNQANLSLQAIKDKLKETQKMKEDKEKELNDAKLQIQKLEKKKAQCQARLKNANILNSSLGNEKEEWKKKKSNLEYFSKNIIGDILISSGIISYLGAFTKSYREQIIFEWAKKIKSENIPISFNEEEPDSANSIMRQIIGDDMQIETWKSQNLPNDNFSTDNAIIMENSRRYCLLIDPQSQALIWLKEKIKQERELYNMKMNEQLDKLDKKTARLKMEEKHRRKKEERRKDGGTGAHYTIKPTFDNKTLIEVTMDAVTQGKNLIYENVGEELNQAISPIYKKEYFNVGKEVYVNFNKSQIKVDKNFNLFIVTQLPKPHYLPEICVSLTLVNFTVTEEGLQDQMLNFLVEKEDPTLNSLRKQCIDTKNQSERKKKEIEAEILFQLADSKKCNRRIYYFR